MAGEDRQGRVMGSDKQHSFRVATLVKAAFGAYAANFGLQESELMRVLIIRERHHCQLRAFIAGGGQVTGSGGDTKVTAHFSSIRAAMEFREYAASCGLGSGRAGAWIIERELAERWFEGALAMPPLLGKTAKIVAETSNRALPSLGHMPVITPL